MPSRQFINHKNDTQRPQDVRPLKSFHEIAQVKATLLQNFKFGRRNYTIFQVGKATMLRISDLLNLKYTDVFTPDGQVKTHARIHDRKTGKLNDLYLAPVATDLLAYHQWLQAQADPSLWLFPDGRHPTQPLKPKQFYHILKKVGYLLGLEHLGTHTMRKTGAYLVYQQSHYNLALVMKLLNHTSAQTTLKYLGLDQETTDHALANINFG